MLNIDAPDPRLRDVELLLRLIAWRRFSKDYKGNMKAFLDEAMVFLNKRWGTERTGIEDLTQQLFHATATALKLFGKEVGRKFKYGRYERSLNRALFEVQAYYFSFPKVRTAATKSKMEVVQASKELFSDTAFTASIESTTKSVENYRTRFSKYQKMLQDTLGIKLPSIEIAIQSK